MTKTILDTEKTDHGICLIDVFREPGDLYDSWDIVRQNKDGTFSRNPNAGYGCSDRDTSDWTFEPVHVTEHYSRWDENGWTKSETVIRANGKVIASRGN